MGRGCFQEYILVCKMQLIETPPGNDKIMKMKKWKDIAGHKTGCPYSGVAVYGTEEEMIKYHSGYCPGCNTSVKWEEEKQEKNSSIES